MIKSPAKAIFLCIFICMASNLFSQQPSTQPEEFITEGSGMGANEQEALMAAKRDAVEKGIGMILLSQTEIENFMVTKDQVITKTVGTVKTYEKISESQDGGVYKVTIKATLSKSALREDLAAFHILIESMNKPRVMVIVKENNVGNDQPTNQAAENIIIQFLKTPYEFDLVDPKIVADIRSSDQELAKITGNVAAAAAIGAQNGAEVLITGSAVAREATDASMNMGGMKSVQADVTLTAINCATGKIINSADAHAAQIHISPNTAGTKAIQKAAQKAMEKLLDSIIKEWQNQLNNGISITVTVGNVSTFRTKNQIIQTFQSMSGMSAVRERSWDGTSKLLIVDLQYKGNVDGFCSKADGYKIKDGSGSVSVSGVSGQKVTMLLSVM